MGCETITGLTQALNLLQPIYILYAVGQISFLRLNLFQVKVDQNYTANHFRFHVFLSCCSNCTTLGSSVKSNDEKNNLALTSFTINCSKNVH